MSERTKPDAETVLAQRVFAGDAAKPFGELTLDEVEARAAELRGAAGWGPTAKVGSVARAWAELGRLMQERGAQTVGALPPDAVSERAEKLWIVPPGGSLL